MSHLTPRIAARLALTVLAAASATTAVPALAQSLVLYDDFAGSVIDATKWINDDGCNFGGFTLDGRRSMNSGQLRLESRGYGDNVNDAAIFSTARSGLRFDKSASMTAMKATITPRIFSASTCSSNSAQVSQARARLFGFFFNAGTSVPNVGGNTNDVYAGIQLYRSSNSADTANSVRVVGFYGICNDDNCTSSTQLGSTGDILASAIAANTPVEMSVTWNASTNSFSFQAGATLKTLTYTVPDTYPASFPAKRIEAYHSLVHCSAARATSNVVVDIDNVYTN